jgi:hypothetical protein
VPSVSDVAQVTLDGMQRGVDLDMAIWIYSETSRKYVLVWWKPEYGNTHEVATLPVEAGRKYWIEILPDKIYKRNQTGWNKNANAYTLEAVYR